MGKLSQKLGGRQSRYRQIRQKKFAAYRRQSEQRRARDYRPNAADHCTDFTKREKPEVSGIPASLLSLPRFSSAGCRRPTSKSRRRGPPRLARISPEALRVLDVLDEIS